MNRFDEQLQKFRRQMIRKEELKALLRDLYARQKALSPVLRELEERLQEEQADVDRLNRLSLNSAFYGIIGKREQKLCIECREAQEAAAEYRQSANEMEQIEAAISKYEEELRSTRGCERGYRQLIEEKAEAIRSSAAAEKDALLRLDERIAALDERISTIQEAIYAGGRASGAAYAVQQGYDRVLLEPVTPGPRFMQFAEVRERIDAADSYAWSVQDAVRKFQDKIRALGLLYEVDTIGGSVPIQDSLIGMFVPEVFSVFQSLLAGGEAEKSQKQISEALEQLRILLSAAEEARAQARNERDGLIERAGI